MSGSSADNITEVGNDGDDDCSNDDVDDDPGILLGNTSTTTDDDANETEIRAFIDAGEDVNIPDNDGRTALFYAAQQSSNESVVHAMIDAGADVNITDNNGQTALFYAAQQSSNESVVHALIDAGADVNITDNNGQTALFYAVQQDQNESVIRAFIDSDGALVNVQDTYGRTAFFYALHFPKSAHILVGGCRKFPFRLKDHFGCSILDFFVERRLIHGDIDDFLSQKHDFFNLLEQCEVHKITFAEAIFSVVFCIFPLMFREGTVLVFLQAQITRALQLASQFIGNKRCKKTQMLTAIINEKCGKGQGVSEAFQLLVKLGGDPNCVDSDGNTALHYATRLPLRNVPSEVVMEVCRQLKHLGMQFNLRNHANNTPLLFCLSGNIRQLQEENQLSVMKTLVEICRFLLECRSSIEERTVRGKTVFHLMLECFQQGLRLINDKTIQQDFMLEAIKLLQLFSSQKVAAKSVINIPDGDLKSPLHHWATLELPTPQDYSGNTGREDVTFKDFLKSMLNELLSCKAKLNDRDGEDQTPLHLCRTWTAVKLLLDAGAKPNDVDSSGTSSLLAAAKRKSLRGYQGGLYPDVKEKGNSKSFWKTAIDEGLDPWTADKEGESVLSILIRNESFVLAKALVDVACEQRYTQSEAFAVGLLNAICKDQSSRTSWKTFLVKDILKSRKCPTASSEPLRLCCRNLARKFENSSVHCEIIMILLSYGADGESCVNMPEASDALKELLTKPVDLSTMPLLIPWTSISKKYQEKLSKVARRQECKEIHEEFWYHKEHIESGSYGDIFAGINKKDGREVAIKRIVKSRTQRAKDKREIRNLIALADCEQIIRYLHFFEDESFSYLALELMEGNLKEYFTDSSSFDAKKGIQLCQDVLKGLVYLHEQNIIHRDLKPGNILYKTNPCLRLKIADFGLSRRVDSSSTTVFSANAGTRCWMAPEVLRGTDHSNASDLFSCGLVLHYILSGQKHPFSKNNSQMPYQIESNIADGSMEGWDDFLGPEAVHLINDMLNSDKKDRPTAGVALDHPLFWSKKKKIDLLKAVGNQSEFECPRAIKSTPLSAVETDLEKNFSTILVHGKWNDPRYKDMPTIFKEMTSSKRKFYDTNSVVELVRFIRNAYSHVSEDTRPTAVRKMLLEDFVFLEDFPHLVIEVYKAVANHGWNTTKEEIIYEMN